jgi:hypothetical protein
VNIPIRSCFGDQRPAEFPGVGQIDGFRHHELLARVVRDRSAETGSLVHEKKREARLLHGQGRGDSGRPGADDDSVNLSPGCRPDDALEAPPELHALSHGVLDEAHPAELADDMDAGPVRLEELIDLRKVEAALARAEHESYGADRTFELASGMADAIGPDDEGGFPVDDAQNVPFRTDFDAREASDAGVRIDDRVQRRRKVEFLLDRYLESVRVPGLAHLASHEKEIDPQGDRDDGPGDDRRVLHALHLRAMSDLFPRTPYSRSG